MAAYPKKRSTVTISFNDGEVKTYSISAGHGISGYLMQEAASTGVVVLRDDDAGTAVCIPLDRIRDVQFAPEQQNDTETKPAVRAEP
jgi:hypothetical protein